METLDKLTILGSAARFDVCADTCGRQPPPPRSLCGGPIDAADLITPVCLPDGRAVSLLKVLQTNACRHNCLYCANRAQRGHQRVRFRPQELAALFMDFYRRGYVQGLFLSSGVEGCAQRTMSEMLITAEILRTRCGFGGYIHLKVLPGAPYDCVERAVELADRVSVNLEAPTAAQLERIAPEKHLFADVVQRMQWIKCAASRREGLMTAGQSTQLIVGAGRETDREVLNAVNALSRDVGLRRAYFSGFQPVSDTPLQGQAPCPPLREHRLYQVDWLLRRYHGVYAPAEVVFDGDGNLPLGLDPKVAIALRQRDRFPIEINRADYAELLRVPGIGPKSARRIVAQRRAGRFQQLRDLRRLGVAAARAAPFVLINGRAQGDVEVLAARVFAQPRQRQLPLPLGG